LRNDSLIGYILFLWKWFVVGSQIFSSWGGGSPDATRYWTFWNFFAETHPKQSLCDVYYVCANVLLRKFRIPGCQRVCGPGGISSQK